MKVAVIGGSFCPPTLAHLALAKAAEAAVQADKSLLVPVSATYLKKKNMQSAHEQLSDEIRLEMLNAMVANEPKIAVDDYDILTGKPTNVYRMLRHFQEQYPGAAIYFVIGSDKLTVMNRWWTAQAILQEFYVLVATRENDDVDRLMDSCQNLMPHRERFTKFQLPGEWDGISSTMVREFMQNSNYTEAKQCLSPEVFRLLCAAYSKN